MKTLSGESRDIRNLKEHLEVLKAFLALLNRVDALPESNRRLDGISPFQVVVRGIPRKRIEDAFHPFFGAPVKPAGGTVPLTLKFDSAVRYLGGIRSEQAYFVRKVGNGVFYGAIWPWTRKPEYHTVHLGYHSKTLSDRDFQQIEELILQSTHRRLAGEMEAAVGGQIHGISLPAFLQMSEMEKTTATLKIRRGNRVGMLFLGNGNIIDAKTDQYTGKEAAYRIISWDNASIEIDKSVPSKLNVIKEPLMKVLMESLKIKDEEEYRQLEKEDADPAVPHIEGRLQLERQGGGAVRSRDQAGAPPGGEGPSFLGKWRDDKPGARTVTPVAVAVGAVLLLACTAFLILAAVHVRRLEHANRALLAEVEKHSRIREGDMVRIEHKIERVKDRVSELQAGRAPVTPGETDQPHSVRLASRVEDLEGRVSAENRKLQQQIAALNRAIDRIGAHTAGDKTAADGAEGKTPAQPPEQSPAIQYHIVKKGENLYRIALSYGLTEDALAKRNGMKKNAIIHPGDRIRITE